MFDRENSVARSEHLFSRISTQPIDIHHVILRKLASSPMSYGATFIEYFPSGTADWRASYRQTVMQITDFVLRPCIFHVSVKASSKNLSVRRLPFPKAVQAS